MTGIFITATGTSLGKTYLVERLLRWDRGHKRRLRACKPVISGWPDNDKDIQHTDTGILLAAQQLPYTASNIAHCSPWRYAPPLTPSMAAKLSGKLSGHPSLPIADVLAHCRKLMREAKDAQHLCLIEGVGGVMAPLAASYTVLDWIAQLGCPCVLIGGSYLGTLSHILTAVVALQSLSIPILGVVVNETLESTVSLNDTVNTLDEILSPIPILALSYTIGDYPNGLDKLYTLIVHHASYGLVSHQL